VSVRKWICASVMVPPILLALTACVPSYDPADHSESSDNIITTEEYQEEYGKAVADFPEQLPEGFVFDKEPPPLEGDIVRNTGTGAAYFQWYCAWGKVYLTTQAPEQKSDAMKELRKWPKTEWALKNFEDPDGLWDQMLDAAELGDLSDLKSFYAGDCEDNSG
jgi:hypothetical protein